MKSILISIMFLYSVAFIGCAPKEKPENACGFVQDRAGQRVSWSQNLPVLMYYHESFPEENKEAVVQAMAVWEKALGRKAFILANDVVTGPVEATRDGLSVIYWFKEWEGGHEDEQGRTDLYSRGHQIIEADLRVNAASKQFDFYLESPQSSSQVHLESLLVHELGHILGLAHTDSEKSVMRDHLAPNVERVELSPEDQSNVLCEY